MSVAPVIPKGQNNFKFPNSSVWFFKEPKNTFLGVSLRDSLHSSRTLDRVRAQGQKKQASNAEILTENGNSDQCLIKSETINSAKNVKCDKSASTITDGKSHTVKQINNNTVKNNNNDSLSTTLLTKSVNMQSGKALNKRRKSICNTRKAKSPGTKLFTSGSSNVSVSKLQFRLGGHNGSAVTLPSSPTKMHESGKPNLSKSVSPVSHSVSGKEYLQTMPVINNGGNQSIAPLRRSLNQSADVYTKRLKKIFLSEKQSGSLKIEGTDVPCAPPATPTSEQLLQCEYIPSLNDIRAQRAVRHRLQVMEKKEQRRADRKKEEQVKVEKQMLRQREFDMKRQQRQEIYALNEAMMALENKRFQEFCTRKVSVSEGGIF